MVWTKWTTKKIFVAAIFSAATYVLAFVLGSAVSAAFGPGTSGVVSGVLTTIVVVVGAKIVNTRGVFTLMVGLFTVFAVPTNMFGPPGPQKIVVGLLTGLVYDVVWNLCRAALSKRFSSLFLPFAAAAATASSVVLVLWLMVFLNAPRTDLLERFLLPFALAYGVLGFLGGILGEKVFKRIEDLAIVNQLRM